MNTRQTAGTEVVLLGIQLTPGVGAGILHWVDPVLPASRPAAAGDWRSEAARLGTAVEQVRQHLASHIRDQHAPADEDFAQVLRAHAAILEDERFFESVERRLRDSALSAEEAVRESFSAAAERLHSSQDSYLRSRAEDLRDICQAIRQVLHHGPGVLTHQAASDPRVLVSANLLPSLVLQARRQQAAALVTASRSTLSHGALLARASGIPTVAGVDLSGAAMDNGTPVLVDADAGQVVLWPSGATVDRCHRRRSAQLAFDAPAVAGAAVTAAGERIALWANINHPSQAQEVLFHQLAGIGLFRTELLAIDYGRLPNEDEQLAEYSKLMKNCRQCPVVFRTFDLGGDKVVTDLDECSGSNPALGIRGIRRHLLRQPRELEQQFRAILRAAHAAKVSILLPMVTHRDDVAAARQILSRVLAGLRQQGVRHGEQVRLGAMLEVPAAVFAVRDIFATVDFVSIGTNDLVQYLAAADRDNQSVLSYLDPDQAGLPTMIDLVMDAARDFSREEDVFVCGDLASDPTWAARFVAKGVRTLSIIPAAAPQVRAAIAES